MWVINDDGQIGLVSGKTSIGKTLLLAFAVLTILPLVAALVGWINHSQMRTPLQRAASINLAFGSNNQQLASAILEIEQFTSTTSAESQAGLGSRDVLRRLKRRLEQVQQNLDALRAIDPVGGAIAEINSDYGRLYKTINEYLDIEQVQARSRRQLAERVERLQQNIAQLEDLFGDLVASRSLQGQQKSNITELRFTNRSLGLLLENAKNAESVEDIGLLAERFKHELHKAVLQLTLIEEPALRQQLAPLLNGSFVSGSGGESVFIDRAKVVELAQEQEQRRSEVAELGRSILAKSLVMQERNDQDLEGSLRSVSKFQIRSVVSLLVLALLSTAMAAFVYVRYVRRTLVRRLNKLRSATKEITSGELDVAIDAEGSDEISELAHALVLFRQSMLDLKDRDVALKARALELELSNRELDKFAYVASHDLRSPLRGIDSLASFLQEDLADTLPETSARHLRLMRARISRLESLLESLLAYYRVGKNEQVPNRVEMNHLFQHCVDLFSDSHFVVRYSGWTGTVSTYHTPLQLILRNLVDNAIKHHDKDEGQVVITSKLDDDSLIISVVDDGPGIAPEYH
ncbi:MAG: HAMP domain-containing protein, partial [Pseudomonadota bacterium]